MLSAVWLDDARRKFPKIRGTLFWGPYNKDPTIQGTVLGSPIFGNPQMVGFGRSPVSTAALIITLNSKP